MTRHPLLAELQVIFDEIRAKAPERVEPVVERETPAGCGDRGIPVFDGNRGMPNGCAIAGTRPGDQVWLLEADEAFLREAQLEKERDREHAPRERRITA